MGWCPQFDFLVGFFSLRLFGAFPFWISFAAQKKYHFEVHSSGQTWQWKIMVLKSISVNEACSFAMFDYMWVLSCMRSHGV